MRWSVPIAAGLLLVLSGCSLPNSAEQQGPAESVTPAPVPDVEDERTPRPPPPPPSEIPVPDLRDDPPGVSEIRLEGITNESVIGPVDLARAHRAALQQQAVRIHERRSWQSTGVEVRDRRARANRTVVMLPDRTYRYNESRRIVYLESDSATRINQSVFRNRSLGLQRTVQDSNATYARLGGSRPNVRLRNTPIVVQQALWVENISVDRTTWRGEPHYRLDGRGVSGGLYGFATGYRVSAIVREDGLVRRLSVNYTESPIGRERVVDFTITIDPIERDRLDAPPWLAEALNRTRTP